MELKRVVVTGLGSITPIGNDAETTWKNAVEGVSGAGPITHFDASLFKTQFACEVKGYNSADHFDRKEARKMDLYEQYALVAAMEAVKDCGVDLESVDKNRIGVVLGVGIGGIHTFEEEAGNYAINGEEMGPKYNPFFIPKMIADIAAGQISIQYGFHGPNYTTTSACASSTNALADAFNLIRLGKADAMVTGGAEAAVSESGVGGFNSMNALPSGLAAWADLTPCTRSQHATTTPHTLHAPSARAATALSWARVPVYLSLRNLSTPRHAAPRFTARWLALACRPTHTTSLPHTPKASVPTS